MGKWFGVLIVIRKNADEMIRNRSDGQNSTHWKKEEANFIRSAVLNRLNALQINLGISKMRFNLRHTDTPVHQKRRSHFVWHFVTRLFEICAENGFLFGYFLRVRALNRRNLWCVLWWVGSRLQFKVREIYRTLHRTSCVFKYVVFILWFVCFCSAVFGLYVVFRAFQPFFFVQFFFSSLEYSLFFDSLRVLQDKRLMALDTRAFHTHSSHMFISPLPPVFTRIGVSGPDCVCARSNRFFFRFVSLLFFHFGFINIIFMNDILWVQLNSNYSIIIVGELVKKDFLFFLSCNFVIFATRTRIGCGRFDKRKIRNSASCGVCVWKSKAEQNVAGCFHICGIFSIPTRAHDDRDERDNVNNNNSSQIWHGQCITAHGGDML